VHTDGEIKWKKADADFDWQHTTALPDVLSHKLPGEPLWIDVRDLKSEAKLKRNNEFKRRIAQLVAAIEQVPLDSIWR